MKKRRISTEDYAQLKRETNLNKAAMTIKYGSPEYHELLDKVLEDLMRIVPEGYEAHLVESQEKPQEE